METSELVFPLEIDGHRFYGMTKDGELIDDSHPFAFETKVALGGTHKVLAVAHGNPVPGDGPPPGGS